MVFSMYINITTDITITHQVARLSSHDVLVKVFFVHVGIIIAGLDNICLALYISKVCNVKIRIGGSTDLEIRFVDLPIFNYRNANYMRHNPKMHIV